MPEIIDQLASLTALRDRDTLDVSLAHALRDLLDPQCVSVHRLLGDAGQQRWLMRASLVGDQLVATADPPWIDFGSLPPAAERPDWLACMQRAEVVTAADGAAITLFPLMSDSAAIGVVEVRTRKPVSAKTRKLVFGMLRIFRNVQSLLDYSERDTLTGLLNRKIFDDSFYKVAALPQAASDAAAAAAHLSPATTEGEARDTAPSKRYWLGLLDIDHFKSVNDTYGHLIGDEVLLLMSRLMRTSFRYSDQLYRFGGEEFVVLLLCANEADAMAALERFRSQVEAYPFPQVGRITVSIGLSSIEAGDTPARAFERADRAVYHAKHTGRNQVCNHAELLRTGVIVDDSHVGDVELF